MRLLDALITTLVAATTATLAASALGGASPFFFVVGLLSLAIGLAAGVGAATTSLLRAAPIGRTAHACAWLGVLVGWLAFQAWDDHHFRGAWARDLAQAREVASGLPADSGFGEESVPFFAPDASSALRAQVETHTGRTDAVGRWLLRADAGVRLMGPWSSSRGLPVGRGGAMAWALLEVLAAGAISSEVLRRVASRRSTAEADDLDRHAHDEQDSA